MTDASTDDGEEFTRKQLNQSIWILITAVLAIQLVLFAAVLVILGELLLGSVIAVASIGALLFHEAAQGRAYARAFFEVLNRGPMNWGAAFPEEEP